MKLYRYVVKRDFGFAPNPYFGICTLATCKPQIRLYAKVDDWIAGFGSKETPVYEKLVYLMKVTEKLSFDEYWNDIRFEKKKPNFYKALKHCYGDNVYHHDLSTGDWLQENCHHSYDNKINYTNLNHDTKRDAVLISNVFWYFGRNACSIPDTFHHLIAHGRPNPIERDTATIEQFIEYMKQNFQLGINGIPFDWGENMGFERFHGER